PIPHSLPPPPPPPRPPLFPYTTLFRSSSASIQTTVAGWSERQRASRGPVGTPVRGTPSLDGRSAIFFTTSPLRLQTSSEGVPLTDRKSTRLNSSHVAISYAVFCLKKKK